MSVHALSDHRPRRPAIKAGPRREARRSQAAPGRASLIEDFLVVCELDPAVEALRVPTEPAVVRIGAETIAHQADFELVCDGAAALVDVVAEADLAAYPLRAALVGGELRAEDGRAVLVETARTLRAEPRFTTVRLIMACRRTFVSAGDRVRILHYLDESGTARLVDCAGVVQNAMDGVACVLALAVEGLVAVDISRPILPETPVRRRKLPYSDPFGF